MMSIKGSKFVVTKIFPILLQSTIRDFEAHGH